MWEAVDQRPKGNLLPIGENGGIAPLGHAKEIRARVVIVEYAE
jgi:hypothetical protein